MDIRRFDHLKSESCVEMSRTVFSLNMETNRLVHRRGLGQNLLQQGAPNALTLIGRQEGDINDSDLALLSADVSAANRFIVKQDEFKRRRAEALQIIRLLQAKLHVENGIELTLIPIQRRQFVHACVDIQLAEKRFVLGTNWAYGNAWVGHIFVKAKCRG